MTRKQRSDRQSDLIKNMTPRQRVAIAHPCISGANGDHARFHRRTGGWQTILTFDLFVGDGQEPNACWHARATTWPMSPLAEWNKEQQRRVKEPLQRLLVRIGEGSIRIEHGAEKPFPTSIHFYKQATEAEIWDAVKAGA